MKKFKVILITAILIIASVVPTFAWVSPNGYTLTDDEKFYIENKLNECTITMDTAHKEADIARTLGLTNDSEYIQERKSIWHSAKNDYDFYSSFIDKFDEYPVATIIWVTMKDWGYSDYLCAGIIGNMMVECGGLTLDLDADIYSGRYYGLCMWNYYTYYDVCDMNVIQQMDFLLRTIEYEIDTYGWLYADWMNYKNFLNV